MKKNDKKKNKDWKDKIKNMQLSGDKIKKKSCENTVQ